MSRIFYSDWGQALGVGETVRTLPTPAAKAHLIASHLRNWRLLLVLDDVWEAEPARLLANVRGPNCGLLVTTRLPLVAASLDLDKFTLHVLKPREALELLARHRGRAVDDAERKLAEELVKRLGYHALAVKLAGSQLRQPGRDWDTLLLPLRHQQGKSLAVLDLSDSDRENSLRVCFNLSYDNLTGEDERRYRWLGVMASEATIKEAAVLALWAPDVGFDADDYPGYTESVIRTLHALLDFSLVGCGTQLACPIATRIYQQHALLREDALRRLDAGEQEIALARHARIYVNVADQAARAGNYRPIAQDYAQIEAVLRRSWRAWQHAGDAIDGRLSYPTTGGT